ncbi:MAG: hypothetical protein HY509_01960 [Acidobacteria bacterium]|nr:hypothetical protein [Acidobacteriota bacterium]
MSRSVPATLARLAAGMILLAGCASSTAENPPANAANRIPPEQMVGLNFNGMTDAQKAVAETVMNVEGCTCGCGMTLAACRRDDSTCTTSLGLGTQVVALARQGKTHAEIIAALNRPDADRPAQAPAPAEAQKRVEFRIPAGDAPFHGPREAPVTILHYLDFQ